MMDGCSPPPPRGFTSIHPPPICAAEICRGYQRHSPILSNVTGNPNLESLSWLCLLLYGACCEAALRRYLYSGQDNGQAPKSRHVLVRPHFFFLPDNWPLSIVQFCWASFTGRTDGRTDDLQSDILHDGFAQGKRHTTLCNMQAGMHSQAPTGHGHGHGPIFNVPADVCHHHPGPSFLGHHEVSKYSTSPWPLVCGKGQLSEIHAVQDLLLVSFFSAANPSP